MKDCKVIAVSNQKGGVGKTTTSLNLGVALSKQGKKVLLIDSDPQGDLTTCLGFHENDIEKSLADLMLNVINDEAPNTQSAIIKSNEGVDLIPGNLDLSAIEVSLVNAMNREFIIKGVIQDVKKDYDYIIIDSMPSLGMLTINALAS